MIERITNLQYKKLDNDGKIASLEYKLGPQIKSIAFGADEPITDAIWEKIQAVYKPGVLSETQLMNRLKKFAAELSSDHTVQVLNKRELVIK